MAQRPEKGNSTVIRFSQDSDIRYPLRGCSLPEFIKIHIRNGVDAVDAARQASRDRFRAVLLPLMSERSTQAQILIPLAVSIVFGLMASTVLVEMKNDQ